MLKEMYKIAKANGEPVDPKAFYFVLRLDSECDDSDHLEACRTAARAYCDRIAKSDSPVMQQVGTDLLRVINHIENKERHYVKVENFKIDIEAIAKRWKDSTGIQNEVAMRDMLNVIAKHAAELFEPEN